MELHAPWSSLVTEDWNSSVPPTVVAPGDPDGLPDEPRCWQIAVRPEGDDSDASVENDCTSDKERSLVDQQPPFGSLRIDAHSRELCFVNLDSAHVARICAHAHLSGRATTAASAEVSPLPVI